MAQAPSYKPKERTTTMKLNQAVRVLVKAILFKHQICLAGPSGAGKTAIMKQAVDIVRGLPMADGSPMKCDLIIAHPAVDEPTDWKGLPWVKVTKNDSKAEFMPFGQLTKMIDADVLTVVFLDDLGQADFSVQSAIMQPVGDREIAGHKINDNVVFMAATNRRCDKANVKGMIAPLKRRFHATINIEIEVDPWVEWAYTANIHWHIIAYVKFVGLKALISEKTSYDVEDVEICPRVVEYVNDLYTAGYEPYDLYDMILSGAGQEWATGFRGFLKIIDRLPDFHKILFGEPVPAPNETESAVMHATVTKLAALVDKTNVKNVIKFAKTLSSEWAAKLRKDMILRYPELQNTAAYAQWVVELESRR